MSQLPPSIGFRAQDRRSSDPLRAGLLPLGKRVAHGQHIPLGRRAAHGFGSHKRQ